MPIINCKVELELNLIEDCILSSAGNSAKSKITDTKLQATIVTLSTKNNVNLSKQSTNGFKRYVFWSEYQIIPAKVKNNGINIYELLSASLQSVKRLFVHVYDATNGDNAGIKNKRMYFLPRAEIKNYNVLINGRNFYDHPINDLIKEYDEVRKTSIG